MPFEFIIVVLFIAYVIYCFIFYREEESSSEQRSDIDSGDYGYLLLKVGGRRDVANRLISHAGSIQAAIDQLDHDNRSTKVGLKIPIK